MNVAASRLVNTVKLFAREQIAAAIVSNTTATGNTTNTTPVSLRDFAVFAAIATCLKSTGGSDGLCQLDIWASDDSAGTVNVTLIATSGTLNGNTAGDMIALEVSEEEIVQNSDANGYNSTYVWARATSVVNTDLVGLTTIQAFAKAPAAGLTATSTH